MWLFRNSLSHTRLLPVLFGGVTLLSMAVFWVFQSPLVPATVVRRIFFVPPMLAFVYEEYFSLSPPIYWASVLGSLSSLRGDLSEGFEKAIGNYLGIGGHANGGMFAAGFAQAGYPGLLLYGFMFFGLLYVIDCISARKVSLIYAVVVLMMPMAILITSSDFTTVFLSHGLFIAIAILYLSRMSFERIE